MVPDLPGVPRAARRRRRPRARARARPTRATASCSTASRSRSRTTRRSGPGRVAELRARVGRGPHRDRPLVRAARLAAAGGRVARAQPARGAARGRGLRTGLARGVHAGLVRAPRAVPAALRGLRPAPPSCTGAATATRSTRFRRSTTGSRPTATALLACHLGKGYFAAATDPRADAETAAVRVAGAAKELAARTQQRRHPADERHRSRAARAEDGGDRRSREPAHRLRLRARAARGLRRAVERTGETQSRLPGGARPRFAGELVGARVAHLLPGVWSTRTWIKLANRACEAELLGYAEPLAALAERFGAPDERPALRLAWRTLLPNHAHDSICGCSRDDVHEAMRGRFEDARGLARETAARALERLAGGGVERCAPWSDELEVAVWNPSPQPRSGLVRFPLDPHPWLIPAVNPVESIHPLLLRDLAGASFTADGAPARLVPRRDGPREAAARPRGLRPRVRGRRRAGLRLEARRAAAARDAEPGRSRARRARQRGGRGRVRRRAHRSAQRRLRRRRLRRAALRGPVRVEDVGDRGDSYDFDFGGADETQLVAVDRGALHASAPASRASASSGASRCRAASSPAARAQRRARRAACCARSCASRPGRRAWTCACTLENTAEDHRLRLLLPGGPAPRAAPPPPPSTWCERASETPDDASWVQRAVADLRAAGLRARGRPHASWRPVCHEAELRPDGAGRRHRAHAAARRRTSLAARPALAPRSRRPRHRHARRAVSGRARGAAVPLRRARPRRRARRRAAAPRRADAAMRRSSRRVARCSSSSRARCCSPPSSRPRPAAASSCAC